MKIVAELSANHNGSLERALQIVDAIAAAGAHAVKLQTWAPGKMVVDSSIVLREGPWVGMNLAELYERAHMPWESQRTVFAYARSRGLECFSSVFDLESLAFLESLSCPRYKIASFELVDLPLIHAVAQTKKPMILSTGMADIGEIEMAVDVANAGGCRDLTLLKCTSAYPADGSAANLRTMNYFRERMNVTPGLSDHTPGIGVALVALAWGAQMIEKHVTLSRAEGGLDAAFSIEPDELAMLVRESTTVQRSLGTVTFGATEHEKPQLELRRSLYFATDMAAGSFVGEDNVRTARPAKGLNPRFYRRVLGAKLVRDVRAGQPVHWELLEVRKPVIA